MSKNEATQPMTPAMIKKMARGFEASTEEVLVLISLLIAASLDPHLLTIRGLAVILEGSCSSPHARQRRFLEHP